MKVTHLDKLTYSNEHLYTKRSL
ncbi:hypothetical protein MARINON1_20055 [Marinobacter salarius]|nr:hypothetical protein MBHK15_90056 [Marinobacter salarius]VXA92755.1 hypothetical protein MARINON1_20055 [Marinobacter salarius]